MKKILIGLLALVSITTTFAQTTPKITTIRSANPYEKDMRMEITKTNKVIKVKLFDEKNDEAQTIGKESGYLIKDLNTQSWCEVGKTVGAVTADVVIILSSFVGAGQVMLLCTGGWGASMATVIAVDAAVVATEAVAVSYFEPLQALNPLEHYNTYDTLETVLTDEKQVVVENLSEFELDLVSILNEIEEDNRD